MSNPECNRRSYERSPISQELPKSISAQLTKEHTINSIIKNITNEIYQTSEKGQFTMMYSLNQPNNHPDIINIILNHFSNDGFSITHANYKNEYDDTFTRIFISWL
jgi:hypothetical protein